MKVIVLQVKVHFVEKIIFVGDRGALPSHQALELHTSRQEPVAGAFRPLGTIVPSDIGSRMLLKTKILKNIGIVVSIIVGIRIIRIIIRIYFMTTYRYIPINISVPPDKIVGSSVGNIR